MNLVAVFSGQGLQNQGHWQSLNQTMSPKDKALFGEIVPNIATVTNGIYDNIIAQPFIFGLQFHRHRFLLEHGMMPSLLAGYSLGEVSAWCCSVGLEFEQGLQIVVNRAYVMENNCDDDSALLSLQGLNQTQINVLTNKTHTHVSIKLNEVQYIIAGTKRDLSNAQNMAIQMGAKAPKLLNVNIPSHSPLMGQADEQYLMYLSQHAYPNMTIPIISATNATKYQSNNIAMDILAHQITHSLDWDMCVQGISEHQPSVILEIGPGNALTKMINSTMPDVPCRSFDDFSQPMGVLDWLERHR